MQFWEDVELNMKKFHNFNTQEIKSNPKNYDTWFDYTKLEESSGDIELVRDLYERSISEVPPVKV